MEVLSKAEKVVLEWVKDVPHLPSTTQKWISQNVWWIALIFAVIGGIGVLYVVPDIFLLIMKWETASQAQFVITTFIEFAIAKQIISLVLSLLIVVVLALAVSPLRRQQKKGWVLLFLALLLEAILVVVGALLSLSIFGFIVGVIFGGIFLVALAYFLFEIHGRFNHVAQSSR